MFINKDTISQLKENENHIPETIKVKFREWLETGTNRIIYKLSPDGKQITYCVFTPLCFLSFCVSFDHTIKDATMDLSRYHGLLSTFASFIYDKESKMTDDDMVRLYGEEYLDSKALNQLSSQEIKDFYQVKSDFQNFINQIEQEDEENEKTRFDYNLEVQIETSKKQEIDFRLNAFAVGGKSRDHICGNWNVLNSFYFTHSSKVQNPSFLNMLAKAALLYRRIKTSGYSYYYENNTIDLNDSSITDLIDLAQAITDNNADPKNPKANLVIDDTEMSFSGSRDVDVKIDENGGIRCDYRPEYDKIFYSLSNKTALLLKDNQYQFLHFNSRKSEEIYRFLLDHPKMRFDLMQRDITTKLVPKVASDINVDPNLIAKSLKLVNHIELFLSLEADGILSESRAFIQGKQVSLEQYQSEEPNKYNAFAYEMQKLFLPFNGVLKDEELINQYLSADLSGIKKTAAVFISEELKNLKRKPIGKIQIIVKSNEDWFQMNFKSDEYTDEEIAEILSAYKKKKKFFRLRGDYLSLTEGEIGEALKQLSNDIDFDAKSLDKKIPIYQALKLKDSSISELSDDIMKLFNEIQDYENVKLNVNPDILSVLRPYQIKGIQWMSALSSHNLSGILADDMGLGKTLEMIAFLSQDKTKKPTLIVSPKSLTYNWEAEFNKWNPEQDVVVLSLDKVQRHEIIQSIKNDEDVVYVIPYDSLRLDLDYFKNIEFKCVVIDEGQYIANALSKKAKAIKELKADHRFALTGTPIQNSLMDLWSIFDFLMPGYFKSFSEFKKSYGKLDISDKDRAHLERIVSPFILKRKKEDVLKELPGKSIEIKTLSMSSKEQDLYNAYLINVKKSMAMEDAKKLEILAELTRLRQICVDPSMFIENFNDLSSKLEYCVTLLKQATMKGHKVLVFSAFRQVLDHLGEELGKQKVSYDMIVGDTPAKKRVEMAEDFNTKPDIQVMLISLKAGGTGLNLIGADIVIHLDPWWNVASEDQATDRAYRIGQERKVTVYKLVMKNTVEERVISLQEKKKALNDIIDNKGEAAKGITDEDIRFLLS